MIPIEIHKKGNNSILKTDIGREFFLNTSVEEFNKYHTDLENKNLREYDIFCIDYNLTLNEFKMLNKILLKHKDISSIIQKNEYFKKLSLINFNEMSSAPYYVYPGGSSRSIFLTHPFGTRKCSSIGPEVVFLVFKFNGELLKMKFDKKFNLVTYEHNIGEPDSIIQYML